MSSFCSYFSQSTFSQRDHASLKKSTSSFCFTSRSTWVSRACALSARREIVWNRESERYHDNEGISRCAWNSSLLPSLFHQGISSVFEEQWNGYCSPTAGHQLWCFTISKSIYYFQYVRLPHQMRILAGDLYRWWNASAVGKKKNSQWSPSLALLIFNEPWDWRPYIHPFVEIRALFQTKTSVWFLFGAFWDEPNGQRRESSHTKKLRFQIRFFLFLSASIRPFQGIKGFSIPFDR